MDLNVDVNHDGSGLQGYVIRNGKWLRPAVATLLVVGTPAVMASLDPNSAAVVPTWLVPAGGALGCFTIGMGAATTNTASASVVRLLGFVTAAVILIVSVFR